MSSIKRKLMLMFLKHPKMVSNNILNSIHWKDGNLFEDHQNTQVYILPADFLSLVKRELIEIVGNKVSKVLIYYLNQYSADLIVKDAKEMGFMRFDIIKYFCSIMALFGWGHPSTFIFNPESSAGTIKLYNFPSVSELFESPVHYEFAGIAARVIKLVYNIDVGIEETKCIAMGEEFCEFNISAVDPEKYKPKFDLELEKVQQINAESIPRYIKFKKFLDSISMDETGVLNTQDGYRVIIKDVISINSMMNAFSDTLGAKTLGGILYRCGMSLKFPFDSVCHTIGDLNQLLERISLLGWGKFRLIKQDQNEFIIELENSAFTLGLPIGEHATCHVISGLLHNVIENYLCKKILVVKEEKCKAKGDNICRFNVKML
ncbi:MAG: hypothetical protein GF364_17470 [Candidatus Lokiarchaeota archaeon]|nr:hypothetical protein [Candidatus Lokiarchaeota archaeon]